MTTSLRGLARRAIRTLVEQGKVGTKPTKDSDRPPPMYPAQKRKALVMALDDFAKLVAAGNPDMQRARELVAQAGEFAGTDAVGTDYPTPSAFEAMLANIEKGDVTGVQIAQFLTTVTNGLAPHPSRPTVVNRMTRRDGEGDGET